MNHYKTSSSSAASFSLSPQWEKIMNSSRHVFVRALLRLPSSSLALGIRQYRSKVPRMPDISPNQAFERMFKKVARGKSPKIEPDATERLAKRIARASEFSRREAEKAIIDETVSVNGKKITEVGFNVSSKDVISVNGEILASVRAPKVWIANKLKGELVTTTDPLGRRTIFERLTQMGLPARLKSVVRFPSILLHVHEN